MMFSPIRFMNAVFVSVLFSGGMVGGSPDVALVMRICTMRHYQKNGGYHNCIKYVINEVTAMTAKRGYSYTANGRSQDEFSTKCYGHGACNGNLSPEDCTGCLNTALNYMMDYCTTSVGAKTKLQDCRIRYEDYPFDPDY